MRIAVLPNIYSVLYITYHIRFNSDDFIVIVGGILVVAEISKMKISRKVRKFKQRS